MRYQCECGFVYDEEKGYPREGFKPGTKWSEVPANWACPDCAVRDKVDFRPVAEGSNFRNWKCACCGLVYEEAKGWPDDGIAPGTRWEDVPDDWTCPDCGASKGDFEMEVV